MMREHVIVKIGITHKAMIVSTDPLRLRTYCGVRTSIGPELVAVPVRCTRCT